MAQLPRNSTNFIFRLTLIVVSIQHTFPQDYKTAELPGYFFNLSTAFIDFFAWLGWATELKTGTKLSTFETLSNIMLVSIIVSHEMIENRVARTGIRSNNNNEDFKIPHKLRSKNRLNKLANTNLSISKIIG
jgi:hypothetical protein